MSSRFLHSILILLALLGLACGEATMEEVQGEQLLSACNQHNWPLAEHLLEKGISVDHRVSQFDGRTVLMLSVSRPKAVAFLLDRGANPDLRDIHGGTALMLAAEEGKAQTVGLLLADGADPNLRDSSGLSALDRATKARRHDVVELLRRQLPPTPEH
ncbi:MAG: ankyrin repeat domain-containing protein [Acidobacteriota bacterium]